MMVAAVRPRVAKLYSELSISSSPLVPQNCTNPLSFRHWKRLFLLMCVVYMALLLLWCVYLTKSHVDDTTLGTFISATNLDEKALVYLSAHEDDELRRNFSFHELENAFLSLENVSMTLNESAMTEAQEHAKTLQRFPVLEKKRRRLQCIGWRATAHCDPYGIRVPALDHACSKQIPFGAAGYCEIQDKDTGERFRVMHRYCSSIRASAKFRCAEAWDFATFAQQARESIHNVNFRLPHIAMPPNPVVPPRDGILLVIYPRLLASAYATIRALRELQHCNLPIELWFRPHEMNYFTDAFAHFQASSQQYHVSYREIHDVSVTGFGTKVYALCHSQFDRVLFLDADNVPVRDPTYLFEILQFRTTGALFWPDFWHPNDTIFNLQPHSLVWELLDLPFVHMFEQESGQLLIDRRRHAVPLQLVHFYTFHRPNHWNMLQLAHGDKDLFRFAWLKLGASFQMIARPPGIAGKVVNDSFCGMTMVQFDPDGHILFLHRNSHKLLGKRRRKGSRNNNILKAAAARRAYIKRLRQKGERTVSDKKERPEPTVADTPSPTLEPPEPDGYPDMVVWTHVLVLKNTSRRSEYHVETYTAAPEFDTSQTCYGRRYANASHHFETLTFVNLSFSGLETAVRRFAMEIAQLMTSE